MGTDGAFRYVNDSIRSLATEDPENEPWEFFCECADVECRTLVSLSLLEFDERRAASPPVPVLATYHGD